MITSDKYRGGGRLLATLTLQPGEPKTVRYEVGSRVALVASFAGDATYEARRIRQVVKAEVSINQTMRRWDDRRTDTLYRMRSVWPGDAYHVRTVGDWEHVRFTR